MPSTVTVASKLLEIFKDNAQANVNLRAAVNAMLVLNKIKTVSHVRCLKFAYLHWVCMCLSQRQHCMP